MRRSGLVSERNSPATGGQTSPESPEMTIEGANLVQAKRSILTGAVLVVLFQLGYLAAHFHARRELVPAGLLNIALAAVGIMLVPTAWFERHWRSVALIFVAAIASDEARMTLVSQNIVPQFTILMLCSLGTAGFLPWGRRWQALNNLACLASLAVVSFEPPAQLAPLLLYYWVSLLTAAFAGEAISIVLDRSRRELFRRVEASRRSESSFRSLVENTLDMVVVMDAEGTIGLVSPSVESTLGYQPAELVGRKAFDFVHPDEVRKVVELFGGPGDVAFAEFRFRHRNGSWRTIDAGRKRLPSAAPPVQFLVNARDVTERKQAEEARSLWAAVAEASDDAIISTTADNRISSWNPSAERLFGYSAAEIIGKPARILIPKHRMAEARQISARLERKEKVQQFETERLRKDGSLVEVSMTISPLYDPSGTMVGSSVVCRDVGERKRAERERAESEAKFRRIFESSLDTVTITRLADSRFVEVNPEWVRVSGFSREEGLGKTPQELGVWADVEQRQRFMRELQVRGFVRDMEADFRTKDGRLITTTTSAVIVEVGGEPCVLTIFRDVTALKKAERELRESEAKFRGIFDSSLDPITISDFASGRYVAVNEEFVRRIGLSRAEALGKTSGALGIWAHKEQYRQLLRELQESGTVRNLEVEFRARDGTILQALVSATVTELGGRPCVLAISRDVAALKQAQKELRESEAKFRQIFDSSLDSITIYDLADGRCVDVNKEFVRRTGFSRADALGKTAGELGIWAHKEQLKQFLRELQKSPTVRNMEVEFRAHDGTILQSLLSATVTEVGGRPCILTISRDVAALKKVQRELIEAREAALAASRAKSEFLSVMSHEIRTPMNALLGMTELLEETSLSPEQREYVAIAKSSGNALLELINGVLDLARIESGRMTLEAVDFDLGELVEKLLASLAVRAHEKQLELAAHILPGVPLSLTGDPVRLRQILMNLIGNAIKFTTRGEVVLRIAADPDAREDGVLRFSVSDTGIGIPADKLAVIFDAFAQADSSTTRRYGGTGLGLTISKRLVELMSGRLWVESEVGKGSTFHATARFAVRPAPAGSGLAPDLSGARIMLVDDSATSRLILSQTLRQAGAEVAGACDADDAFALVEYASRLGGRFDVWLIDSRMPGMDGFEVAKRVKRALPGRCRVIAMLTSDNLGRDLARVRELAVDGYLVKPIKRSELFEALAGAARKTAAPFPARAAAGGEENPASERSLNILLAEDSADNRLLVEAYLHRTPHRLTVAENGEIAVQKFIAGGYDLVLMDVQMPVMGGYSAARAIREWERLNQRRPTPIIALTAYALKEEVARSFEAGCNAHLTKPLKRAALLAALAEWGPRSCSVAAQNSAAVVYADVDLKDLIPEFLRRKRRDAEEILKSPGGGDYETVETLAHNLKGEGSTYGFDRISELGIGLEAAAKRKDSQAIQTLAGELASYLRGVEVVYR